jgi:ribosome recycling factor
MAYNFQPLKQAIAGVEEWLKKEFQGIRTGRATPSFLDSIQVEAYGSRMPLNQVGGIAIEDARTLRISPWDMSQVKAIEKAIVDANLGVGVGSDDKGVRISFPELSSERRTQLIKLMKEKLEEARVRVRSARTETMSAIEKSEKEGGMGKDELFRLKAEVQKIIDDAGESLDALAEKKEQEIQN